MGMRYKQFVGGAEHFELGAAVQLVAYLLMLPGLLEDEILGEHIVFLQPGIFLRELPADCLRAFLAISHRGKAIFFNAVSYEVIHYRLGAALRQSLVVLAVAFVIAMGTQFDGYVGILFQQGYELIQSLGAGWRQGSFVKIIEDVVDEYWG